MKMKTIGRAALFTYYYDGHIDVAYSSKETLCVPALILRAESVNTRTGCGYEEVMGH
jgi:hypothetical protein